MPNKPPTVVGQIPRVVVRDSPDLQRFIDAVTETIEVREGRRGNSLDAFVRFRDLLDMGAGLFEMRPGGGVGSGGGSPIAVVRPPGGGVGGSAWCDTPPVPTELEATAMIGGVFLSWANPHAICINHAYTDIWRSAGEDAGAREYLGRSTGSMYLDMVASPEVMYCYWVRFVNEQNVVGPWSLGACGQPGYDPKYLLQVLDNWLSEDQFTAHLRARLELIDTESLIPGSVTRRLADSRSEVEQRLNEIRRSVFDIDAALEFDPDRAYAQGDIVKYEGKLYRAVQSMSPPVPYPGNSLYWEFIGAYGSVGELVAALALGLFELDYRVEEIDGKLTATAERLDMLAVQVVGTKDFDGVSYETLSQGLIWEEKRVRATEDEALAERVGGIEATISHPTTGLASKASIGYVDTAIANESGARAEQYRTIEASFTQVNNALATKASLSYVDTAIANEAGARAQSTQVITAEVNGIKGDIVNINTVLLTPGTGLVSKVTQLQLDSAAHGTAIIKHTNEIKTVNDGLSATWSVKVDANGRVTGVGLYNGPTYSSFTVVADKFVIAPSTNAPGSVPFYHLTTGANINGVWVPAGTYLHTAFIADATITSAKIGLAAITTAKIGNAQIVTAHIQDGNITNAKIGNEIRSEIFNSTTGWLINKNGNATFSNGTFRGNVQATTGSITHSVTIGSAPGSSAPSTTAGGLVHDTAVAVSTAFNAQSLADAADKRSKGIIQDWGTEVGNVTYINGGKIYAVSAYVDTLHIRGQAVSFTQAVGLGQQHGVGWGTWLQSLNFPSSGQGRIAILAVCRAGGGPPGARAHGIRFYITTDAGASPEVSCTVFVVFYPDGNWAYLSNTCTVAFVTPWPLPAGNRVLSVHAHSGEHGAQGQVLYMQAVEVKR
jgi:uncharacterized protein YjbI with pentapeptide repeats